jgi:hypothetical protein
MGDLTLLEKYFSCVSEEGVYPNRRNLEFYLRFLFDGIPLAGMSVLEVGGGAGTLSFYAGCAGATRVVCLEPEAAGSSTGVARKFRRISERLGLRQVRLEPTLFQSFEPDGETYDVIVLHNSVNHLDEEACIALQHDPAARARYRVIFEKMGRLANGGAHLLLADCSRYNFFSVLRVKHPFTPEIEWHKHQSPRLWAALLSEAGFGRPRIRWASFNTLRTPGRILLGNRIASFFLTSHFCLTMIKA